MDFDENFEFDFVGEKNATSAYVPISTLYRWYLYDMEITNREVLAATLELPPISEEGMQMEQSDSLDRMSIVQEYEPLVKIISEVNGYIISTIQQENLHHSFEELFPNANPEEIKKIQAAQEDAVEFLDQVGFAAGMFLLSVGFKLGLITPGPTEAIREHDDHE
jgi:hypothetical protein